MRMTGSYDRRTPLKIPYGLSFLRLWREFRWIYRPKLWRKLVGAPSVSSEQVFQCKNRTGSQCGCREALMVELHWKFPSLGHIPSQLRDFRWISRPKLWRKLIRIPIRLFSTSFSVYKSNGQSMRITGNVDGRIALKLRRRWALSCHLRDFR